MYEATTRSLLDSVLDGYNATVFAYGATGCGKTHTITGTIQEPGVIFLTMQELFERIAELGDEKVTEVSLSYLEIYNETIRDLLVPGGSKQGLMLREDANQAVSVAGLSSHHPRDVQEVMDMIVRGNEYRTMSPTEANATSSRSHAVLQINISQKDRNADINEPHTMATLSIIDLAGSERASATKNRGERLMEGANINKSLLALGSCINALCDPRKRNHVPYRNSKLTRLLKFSLGGNCKTVMIVCVSPSSQHFDETQNTLRYANRAKNIQTKVTRNVYNVNRHVKDFLVKIDEQMALINELKQQQKDYEATAFAKFRKQNEKRDGIIREGIARIRSAFDHSEKDRSEKTNNMKRLRQIEKRIFVVTSWIAAFDHVCDSEEDDSALQNLLAMRKTAQGILIELEGSRHHYHQRIAKNNWARGVESGLQHSIRQLKEADVGAESQEAASLVREAELLKANADREALVAVAEDDKGIDAAIIQVLLQAHFETIAAIRRILSMSEDEAIEAAKSILGRILNSCTGAASHVIKPDGSLIPPEIFPPTRAGTPKRKKQTALLHDGTPLQAIIAPPLSSSPVRASPKRRKFGTVKKAVSFTPKRKSPAKGLKRGVRWRDDTEEGTLAEFEKTPQKLNYTPGTSPTDSPSTLPSRPPASSFLPEPNSPHQLDGSSPIPEPPALSIDPKSRLNRFKTGYLSKKSLDGSPLPPPPTITAFSSDSGHSPLRDIGPEEATNRSSLHHVEVAYPDSPVHSADTSSASPIGSEISSLPLWTASKSDVQKIRSAIKRTSSSGLTSAHPSAHARPQQRRRSPPAISSTSGSPPNPNENSMFTASHARRMVRADSKENDWKAGILSPRTASVVKSTTAPVVRRTTLGDSRSGALGRDGGRFSMAIAGGTAGIGVRGSLAGGTKGGWR